ncbi:MAG: hypothetical protein HY048_15410 [Acidobacteria bacterium]|nr:hypothetical protein [Acidobacteriota bacterium]
MVLRRARGLVLRLVRRRSPAIVAGLALAAPAAWLEFGARTGAWWADGLALVLGATGAALIWTGVTGLKADWVDEETEN